MVKTYSEKLRDPRWQKKRLEIFERDKWTCLECSDTTTELQVHHLKYTFGKEPWEYDNSILRTLCSNCHQKTHFKPKVKSVTPLPEIEVKRLPFNATEASVLRLLLMYGDLSISPKSKYITTRYTKVYEFIIGEFIRYDLKLESKELQSMFDSVAFNFYNKPEYCPDIELFLNNDNDIIQSFARYTVESVQPISPTWARFGVFPSPPEDNARSTAILAVFSLKLRKINALIDEKQQLLKGADYEASIPILTDIQELEKIKQEIHTDKLYWNG